MEVEELKELLKVPGEDTAQVTAQVTDQVTDQVRNLILVIGDDTKTREEIMELMSLKHRRNFRLTYLKPAIDGGYVDLTIPEKPTSSKQKYFLTAKGMKKLDELNSGL